MRYFMDTEFNERPCTIDLISIGIVCEDGREFYAESTEVDWSQANQWVLENVKPHLALEGSTAEKRFSESSSGHIFMVDTKAEIANQIKAFTRYDNPQFWGWFSDYDWVVFCWLFGSMVDLPTNWPNLCLDLKQWARDLNNPPLPVQQGRSHIAIEDARWNKEVYDALAERARQEIGHIQREARKDVMRSLREAAISGEPDPPELLDERLARLKEQLEGE